MTFMQTKDTSPPSGDPREDDRNDELDESPVPDPEQERDEPPADDPGAD
jgi:hypothetical protein